MNLKFRHKVFLAFLLNSTIIIVSILLIGRYFAERHFEEYVGKVEADRAAKVVEALSREYRRCGSWDTVLQDPGLWFGLRLFGPMTPPADGRHQDRRLPLQAGGWDEGRPIDGPGPKAPLPSEARFAPRHGPPLVHPPIPPIALFDAEKRPLTPLDDLSTQDSYSYTAINVDGRLVGWLGFRKREPSTHNLDVEFMKRESETFYAMGLVALILAGLVTFVLSRHLLAPVKELEKGTRALSSRRFDTRIVVKSRDELGRLAAGFNEMAQALERHQQTQQQWLVDISHELRTPLAILRGEIEAMQDGVRPVTQQGLDSLHQEVLHLSRIVTDLHDLSLIECGSFSAKLAVLNPVEILLETLECFRTRLDQRGITLDVHRAEEGDILVEADADRLKQLFSNILENSLRYVDVPGVLRVFFLVGPGELVVGFEDSGPGVPEESVAFLFDRLYRVDGARSREHGGSGLGLAICKGIVESFGGKIEASNSPGSGLKVLISFPRHARPGAI